MSSLPTAPTDIPHRRFSTMQGKLKEEWMQLCEQAAIEQDANKLMDLVREINRLLEEKDGRLQKQQAKKVGE